jgi:hypothetical protein
MVADTISSVKSRILLKLLLDLESTKTKMDKNAYLNIVSHAKFQVVGKLITWQGLTLLLKW